MTLIITAVLFTAGLGALLALVIGATAKAFAVEADARVETVTEMLPGVNCGGCGFAGCADFAKAIVEGRTIPSQCPVSNPENIKRIAEYLGITAGEKEKVFAVVRCAGSCAVTVRSPYNGIGDCRSAALVAGGAKGCDFGCIGFATCARACPFDAIEMPLLLFLPPLAQPREEEDDDDGEMPGIGGSESCTIRNSAAIGGRCA